MTDYRVIFDDPDALDEPTKVVVPSDNWMPYISLATYATYKTSSSLRFATYAPSVAQDANSVSVVISR